MPHTFGHCNQRLFVAGTAPLLEAFNIDAKIIMRSAHESGQRRRCTARLLQPDVDDLLDRPGRLTKSCQPDHATAALECVKTAANDR